VRKETRWRGQKKAILDAQERADADRDREQALTIAAKAAAITIKAAISADKNVLKAPRAEFPFALKFPQNC
jgi:hypothetical protein